MSVKLIFFENRLGNFDFNAFNTKYKQMIDTDIEIMEGRYFIIPKCAKLYHEIPVPISSSSKKLPLINSPKYE